MKEETKHLIEARRETLGLQDQATREILEERQAIVLAAQVRGEYQLRMVKWAGGLLGGSAIAIYAISALGLFSIALFACVGVCLLPALPMIFGHRR